MGIRERTEKWAAICNKSVSELPEHPPNVGFLCEHCAEKAIIEQVKADAKKATDQCTYKEKCSPKIIQPCKACCIAQEILKQNKVE